MKENKKYSYNLDQRDHELQKRDIQEKMSIRQKVSLKSPDCSIVMEFNTPQDTNELSWLDKFVEESEKSYTSGLFEEQPQTNNKRSPLNEMKFSFNPVLNNQNVLTERKHFQNTNLKEKTLEDRLKENEKAFMKILNHQKTQPDQNDQFGVKGSSKNKIQDKFVMKLSKAGSIKKNKSKITETEFQFTVPSEETNFLINNAILNTQESLEMRRLDEIEKKLDKVIKLDKFKGQILDQSIFRRGTSLGNLDIKIQDFCFDEEPSHRPLSIKTIDHDTIQQNVFSHRKTPTFMSHKEIEDYNAKTTKSNNHLHSIFELLDQKHVGVLSKKNCKVELIPEEIKYILGSIFSKIILKNQIFDKNQFYTFCEPLLKEYSSEDIDKYFQKITFSKSSIEKDNAFEWKKKELARQTQEIKQKNRRKMSEHSHPYINKDFFADKEINSKKPQSILMISQSLIPISRNAYIDVEEQRISNMNTNSQAQIGVFEPKLNQKDISNHLKGLDNIAKLNSKMDSYLKETNNVGGGMLKKSTKEKKLKFDELIKHI